jgi:uncharacterized Tic20 family protein
MPEEKQEEALAQEPQESAPVEEEGQVPAVPAGSLSPLTPGATERRVAAFAHGGILLNLITGIGGVVLALILWLYNDDKTEYGSWHALQALIFQVVVLLLLAIFGGIAVLLWVLTIPLLQIVVGFCLLPFALGFSLFFVVVLIGSLIYGCAGAVAAMEGRDFRYRWISDLIPPRSEA